MRKREMDAPVKALRERGWQLPAPDQVGYVVRDLDRAVEVYEPLFGPFTRMETSLEGPVYRGRAADCKLLIAFGSLGESLEIELIEPAGGLSPHAEFLAAGHEGIHHVRFRIDDLAEHIETGRRFGYHPIWEHHMDVADFAYLEHETQKGVLLELLRMEK
jgi:hypothetical protein